VPLEVQIGGTAGRHRSLRGVAKIARAAGQRPEQELSTRLAPWRASTVAAVRLRESNSFVFLLIVGHAALAGEAHGDPKAKQPLLICSVARSGGKQDCRGTNTRSPVYSLSLTAALAHLARILHRRPRFELTHTGA
jgi:hypothetical protein